MDYIEVTVNFVIPDGTKQRAFIKLLSNTIDEHVFPRLITEEFYYYGVWAEEWLADPPTPKNAVAFSFGYDPMDRIMESLSDGAKKFSREKSGNPNHPTVTAEEMDEVEDAPKSSPSVDLKTPPFMARGKEFVRGYMAGFEAGGGDMVEEAEKFSHEKKNKELGEEIARTIRDQLFQFISFRQWTKNFSREKSSPSVDLKSSDVRSRDLNLTQAYGIEQSNLDRLGPGPDYERGYADGFEAGGGCVSEDLIREREIELDEEKARSVREKLLAHEKSVADMRTATFLANVGGFEQIDGVVPTPESSHVRSPVANAIDVLLSAIKKFRPEKTE